MRIVTFALSLMLVVGIVHPLARAGSSPFFIDPRAMAVVERFEGAWSRAGSVSFRAVKRERLRNGKLVSEELAIKFQKPGRAYVRMLQPVKGREVLYDRSKDPSQLTVHPGHFPDITLHLDIKGMLATHDQHHTIASIGFDEAAHVLRSGIERALRDPHGERLEYAGEARFDGRLVDRLVMLTGSAPARQEKARDGERLLDFARRVDMDAYVIYTANPQIRSLTSKLDAGESYRVPAYYAKRSESWFDREHGMPLKQVMWDESGALYESYEHHELVLDPPLTDLDFQPENPAYDF